MPVLKFCQDCSAPLGMVHKARLRCSDCARKTNNACALRWKINNPDKHKDCMRRVRIHSDKIRANKRQFYANNREKVKGWVRRWNLQQRQLIIPRFQLVAEQTDLLAQVRALVPRGHPAFDDVVGDILLAITNGSVTVKMLRADAKLLRMFSTTANKNLFEKSGFGVESIDIPMRDGRSWHDVLAAE